MRFAVFGIGGFGREVLPIVHHMLCQTAATCEEPNQESHDVVFVDDSPERPSECNGFPVLGFDELVSDEHKSRLVIVAIGDGRTRENIERRCEAAGLSIGSIMAPTVRNLAFNEIAAGSVLCDHVMITSNAKIGKSFQANIYSYVAHDCVIGNYVTFAPRVSCNGGVQIGDYAYIGTGAAFVQGTPSKPITVGEGAIVGIGAVVTKSVPPYTVVVGNPARPIRTLSRP